MHNRRNQVAAKPRPPRVRAAAIKPAPGFPAEVAIPPHRGASARAVDLPLPIPAATGSVRVAAQPLFAMPPAQERLRVTARPKRRKAARRRKPAGRGKVSRARTDPAEGLAAFALPRREEPLVVAEPAPGRAIAPYRPGGLAAQIGHWLARRAESLWQRLGGMPAAASDAELRRLKAENARLRAQLEALLALGQAKPIGAREGSVLPQP